MKIVNGLVFNENHQMENKDLCFQNGAIAENDNSGDVYDATGCYVLPGFIDTHIHGANGVEFYATKAQNSDVSVATEYLAKEGVTSVLATLSTNTKEQIENNVKRIYDQHDEHILGFHLEGPFINPVRKGGMIEKYIQTANIELAEITQKLSGNTVKIMTLAPEMPNALEVIESLTKLGIKVSMGHSDATLKEAKKAIQKGAGRLTHTFNAMRPFNHREPGVLGCALTDDRVDCELICDLHHVSAEGIKIVVATKGIDKVTMISDASFFCGMPEGVYNTGERTLTVENGFAKLPNGTISGSACSLAVGAKNMFNLGFKPEEIAVMASVNPARAAGCSNRGELKNGYRADIIVLDRDFNVKSVFVKGKQIR